MGGDHDETWPVGLAAEHREQFRQLDRGSGGDDATPVRRRPTGRRHLDGRRERRQRRTVPGSYSSHCSGSDSPSRMSSNASRTACRVASRPEAARCSSAVSASDSPLALGPLPLERLSGSAPRCPSAALSSRRLLATCTQPVALEPAGREAPLRWTAPSGPGPVVVAQGVDRQARKSRHVTYQQVGVLVAVRSGSAEMCSSE